MIYDAFDADQQTAAAMFMPPAQAASASAGQSSVRVAGGIR